jgi:2-amino-4-hydroxy-6-hydroxymethyldihydropteridine diphosphokinase / dihydropteroate synthase
VVILGLGSNVGDRLDILRQALALLRKISGVTVRQVSPVYISDALMPEGAPASWDKPYLNCAIRCDTTKPPENLLTELKNIENLLGRKPSDKWAPRPVDIDILAWDDLVLRDKKLHIPHEYLHARPFALWPLADVAPRWIHPDFHGKTAAEIAAHWGSRFSGEAPFHTRQIAQRIDTPRLVGIVNITPDSFSDGQNFMAIENALRQCQHLVDSGAEILDFGAEATNPDAKALDADTEWRRLKTLLQEVFLTRENFLIPPKISIDTRHPQTAEKSLAAGADWINDVSGLSQPAMRELLAAQTCDVVIMHELGLPADRNITLPIHSDPVSAVYDWAEKILETITTAGIQRERIIIDPGIGFGKNAAQCLELLQQIKIFRQLNVRLMIGHSRKVFLKQFTSHSPVERDVETLPISLYLSEQRVDYLRLHNVDMCARAFKVKQALTEI